MEKKIILTCALTGVLATRKHCPYLPYTPKEIALSAKSAYDAGASVVHIHARDSDGKGTFEPKIFAEIAEQTKALCPIILNFSTGSLSDDTSQQETIIRQIRPDMAALNMGTMNYAKYVPAKKDFAFDFVFPNTFAKIERLLVAMNDAAVKPELECFDSGHTNSIWALYDKGVLKKPTQFSFIMGVMTGLPTSVDALSLQKNQIPEHFSWEVIGIGRSQWMILASALVLGGNIRVGLEDNFYLPNGEMAKGNGPLCESAVDLVHNVGKEVANVSEARDILGLN